VNLFVPGRPSDPDAYAAYAARVGEEARRAGSEPGEPRFEDDDWDAKLALVADDAPPVVSFTFGCPQDATVAALQAAGSEVWVTVTDPTEARLAASAGADALVVQGVEAGGHRASFDDVDGAAEIGLLALLQLVRRAVELPLVATGGIASGEAVAAVLAAGAVAAQVGSAYMLCPEAATSAPHREALAAPGRTALTRAFSGRRARGIVNRVVAEHGDAAPAAYPEIHHVTAPLRAKGRERGDAEVINLWAGQTHELAAALPAGELTHRLAADARKALEQASRRLPEPG